VTPNPMRRVTIAQVRTCVGGVIMPPRPSLVRAEVKGGYAMGNHTWNHPDMAALSAARQAAELDQMSAEQRSIAGTVPCAFRPPYGDYDSTTLRLAQQRQMGVWLWSVDTQDWMAEGSGSSYWVHRIIRLAEQEGGALRHPIVLMPTSRQGIRRPSAPCRRSSSSSAHTATASSCSSSFRRPPSGGLGGCCGTSGRTACGSAPEVSCRYAAAAVWWR